MFLDFHRTSKGAFVISADVKVAIGQFDAFYMRYVAACRELHAIPLTKPELLALIGALAERAIATLH